MGQHGVALHWGSMPLGRHGVACHWDSQDRWANSKLVTMGRKHGMAVAMHFGGIALGQQCT